MAQQLDRVEHGTGETVVTTPEPIANEWGVIGPADELRCIVNVVRRYRDGKRWVRVEGPEPITFDEAATGERHEARPGLVSDGASIPRYAYSIVGHPFDEYLESALVHDQGCKDRTRPAMAVHRTFYRMMRAQGVNPVKASLMFSAVAARRPHWRVITPGGPDA